MAFNPQWASSSNVVMGYSQAQVGSGAAPGAPVASLGFAFTRMAFSVAFA